MGQDASGARLALSATLGDLMTFNAVHPMDFVRDDRPIVGSLVWMAALGMDGVLVLDGSSRVVGGITPIEVIRAMDAGLQSLKKAFVRIRAADVARPVPVLQVGEALDGALRKLLESRSFIAVVCDRDRTVGQLTPGSLHRALVEHPSARDFLSGIGAEALARGVRTLDHDCSIGEALRRIARSEETLFLVGSGELVVTPASLLRPLASPEAFSGFLEDPISFLEEPLMRNRSALVRPPAIRRDASLHEALRASIESGVCAVRVEGLGFLTAEALLFDLARELLSVSDRT